MFIYQYDGLLVVGVPQVCCEVRVQVLVLAGLGLAGNAGDEHSGSYKKNKNNTLKIIGGICMYVGAVNAMLYATIANSFSSRGFPNNEGANMDILFYK